MVTDAEKVRDFLALFEADDLLVIDPGLLGEESLTVGELVAALDALVAELAAANKRAAELAQVNAMLRATEKTELRRYKTAVEAVVEDDGWHSLRSATQSLIYDALPESST